MVTWTSKAQKAYCAVDFFTLVIHFWRHNLKQFPQLLFSLFETYRGKWHGHQTPTYKVISSHAYCGMWHTWLTCDLSSSAFVLECTMFVMPVSGGGKFYSRLRTDVIVWACVSHFYPNASNLWGNSGREFGKAFWHNLKSERDNLMACEHYAGWRSVGLMERVLTVQLFYCNCNNWICGQVSLYTVSLCTFLLLHALKNLHYFSILHDGGLACLNDLTGYAGRNYMFLVGPPKPDRP
jgi:hypothetical protein